MKQKKLFLVAAAFLMISAISVRPAVAYFTDSHIATGMVPVSLGDSELTPHEDVDKMVKTITVQNTGDYDVYIRVKPIYGANVTVTLGNGSSSDWEYNEADGYYYYGPIVKAQNGDKSIDNTTGKLVLNVVGPADSDQDTFNVVIIQEATKVLYNEAGTPYADWTLAITESTTGGDNDEKDN